ncbi:hypothetical protein JX266_012977 [Neoarthrinium moseri]|nr:hypothetical protein JX266_012977 [Neoarthrinium moseri]
MNDMSSIGLPHGSFHYFPRLPKELRDVIWEYAALPFVPGIHFFQLITEPLFDGNSWETNCRLEVPTDSRCRGNGNYTSSYLNDVGVWDACCESRQLLEKLSPRNERLGEKGGPILTAQGMLTEEDSPFEMLRSWRSHDSGCDCSYGEHRPEDNFFGSNRPLLINLDQDIICLTLDLDRLRFQLNGTEILGIEELRAWGNAFPVRRLALQFYPTWTRENHHDCITARQEETLADLMHNFSTYSYFPFLKSVYFIDYRITAKSGAVLNRSVDRLEPIFHGKGMTFHEVQRDDDRWNFPDRNAFLLAEELAHQRACSRADYYANDDSDEKREALDLLQARADVWRLDKDEPCQFKVLCCVPTDS